MRHLISIILIASLLSVLPNSPGVYGQDNVNDDGFGLSQSEQDILINFGDLIDFAAIWDTFEGVVNALESTINTLASTVGDWVSSVGDTLSDVASTISEVVNFQGIVDGLDDIIGGLQSTVGNWVSSVGNTLSDVANTISSVLNFQSIVDGLETLVQGLEDTVNFLESLNPFGMILSDNDDADLSTFSEEGEYINNDFVNAEEDGEDTYEDGEDTYTSPLNTDGFDVFILNPQGNESEANGSLIILTNPNATLTDEASDYYSSASEGNAWGELWVNPTIIDPVFEGQVNGLTPGSFGLDQVDNTADLDKPISLALEQELLQKIQLVDDTPVTSNSPCQIGEVYSSAEYFYVCVAENTWKRTNLDSAW